MSPPAPASPSSRGSTEGSSVSPVSRGICDFAGEAASAIVDAQQTQVAAGRLAKILIWFDNEWAYASRMIDVALAWEQLVSASRPVAAEGTP